MWKTPPVLPLPCWSPPRARATHPRGPRWTWRESRGAVGGAARARLSAGLPACCSVVGCAPPAVSHLHAGWLHAFPACDAGDAGDTDPPAMDPGSGVKQGAGPAQLPACPLEASVPRKPARRPERQDARSTYSRQAWALLLGRREPSVPWTPGLCAAAVGARLHTDTALGREVSH